MDYHIDVMDDENLMLPAPLRLRYSIATVRDTHVNGLTMNLLLGQAEALEPRVSVLETLERAAPDATLNDIKALLGRMMFTGKAMQKKVR